MNLFDTLDHVVQQVSGWCSQEKAQTLASMVLATRPEICVEIGVWYGRSLLPVALALKQAGRGKIIGIDPWRAEASVAGQVNPADQEWWNRQDIHEAAYQIFLTNIHGFEVEDFVEIRRLRSDEFEPPREIGVLSVDGNHGDQSIEDIKRYAPRVRYGGFLVADDLNWSGGSVARAMTLLPDMGFKELYRVEKPGECWAVFQRI